MRILSAITDKRINSKNLIVECSFEEYLSFASSVINNNEFQRKRVRTSKTVYSLLKDDLERGCVMPPIVLAITDNNSYVESDGDRLFNDICSSPEKVLILDGLQRTYTLIDADSEMKGKESYNSFRNYHLRLEVYIAINKFGVLYRMLTLNTGQTPMSIRHQLEIMYSDMIDSSIGGVKIIRDTDGTADPDENEFIFKNTIEGFNSYLNRKEFPIDREELLDNIKLLENMSEETDNRDIYREFLSCYSCVFNSLKEITKNHEVSEDELLDCNIIGNPYGKTASRIFATSQAMTGFGAAVGKMKDSGLCSGFDTIIELSNRLGTDSYNKEIDWLLLLLKKMDLIRTTSKKIGNGQRMMFQYFFRELFNKESDSFLNLLKAVDNGYIKYQSQVE